MSAAMSLSAGDAEKVARQYIKALGRSYGGHDTPDAAVDELLALTKPAHADTGTVLAREGEAAEGAFLVVDGRVRASVRGKDGERAVNEALPGEIIGEAGVFMKGAQRSATLTAAAPTTYLVLGRDLFGASARNAALVAVEQHLLRTLVRRIANTDALVTRAWRDAGGNKSALDNLSTLLGSGS
jgi:CRP-like cAMP-binding protein